MLYLLESSDYYKIGYAKDLSKRLRSYSTHNPDYRIIDVMDGDRSQELFLHNLCRSYRYKLEWFYKEDFILDIWNDYKKSYNADVNESSLSSGLGKE